MAFEVVGVAEKGWCGDPHCKWREALAMAVLLDMLELTTNLSSGKNLKKQKCPLQNNFSMKLALPSETEKSSSTRKGKLSHPMKSLKMMKLEAKQGERKGEIPLRQTKRWSFLKRLPKQGGLPTCHERRETIERDHLRVRHRHKRGPNNEFWNWLSFHLRMSCLQDQPEDGLKTICG